MGGMIEPETPRWIGQVSAESGAFLAGFKNAGGGRAEDPAAPPLGTPGSWLGPFCIVSRLAAGGMGTVHLATQEEPRRMVAIKLLRPELLGDDVARERFHREARLVGAFKHENIIRVHLAGEVDGIPFLAMEYVEGLPLSRLIEEALPPPRRAASIALQIARGLSYAHKRGVLHRDVKPSNVLVTVEDDADRVRLLDFGLARQIEEPGLTVSGTVLGTPSYMPPEQVEGGPDAADTRSDLYSLGATLYELLTGRPPVVAPTLLLAMRAIVEETPPAPRSLRAAIPRDLQNVCLRLLAKERDRRYQTADEVAQDLARFLAGEPVLATPATAGYLIGRWIARHRAICAVAGAAVVALVSVVAVPVDRVDERQGEAEAEGGKAQAEADRNDRWVRALTLLEKSQREFATAAELPYQDLGPEARLLKARPALDRARQAVAIAGDLAIAHYDEGRIWYLAGRRGLAEASLRRALEIDPTLSPARYWLAANLLEDSFVGRSEFPESEFLESEAARRALQQALAELDRLLLDPSGFDDQLEFARARAFVAYSTTEDPVRRRAAVERIAGEAIGRAGLVRGTEYFLFLRALCRTSRRESGQRRRLLETAIEVRPRYGLAKLLLAQLRIHAPGDFGFAPRVLREAIGDLDVVIEDGLNLYVAYVHRADAFRHLIDFQLGRGDTRRPDGDLVRAAEADLHRALEARPGGYLALVTRGQLHLSLDRLDEAQAALEEAIARRPEYWSAHRALADAHERRGEMEAAKAERRLAQSKFADWRHAHDMR